MLPQHVKRYIEFKRACGYKFADEERRLNSFVSFATKHGDQIIRTDRVLEWAGKARSLKTGYRCLRIVRRFAIDLHTQDARNEIPPPDALGRVSGDRPPPHLLSLQDICRLLWAATELRPEDSFRPIMYPMLFGLLAFTGMRVSEALALQFDDITDDGLVIRQTKFRKSRIVPLHNTTRHVLNNYLIKRARIAASSNSVFVLDTGNPPNPATVSKVFRSLLRSHGLRGKAGEPGPRLHDLRHSFAVRSLEQCPNAPEIVKRLMPALSTYMGHVHVSKTYWYLEATPLLLKDIAQAGESLYGEQIT